MRIAVVGSINKDTIVQTERLPREGETLMASSLSFAFGGKGANQAVAAVRLGAQVSMVGALGTDAVGREQRESLAAEGVDLAGVATVEGPSGIALITVARDGRNTIIVAAGANAHVTPELVNSSRRVIREADALMLQMEIPVESSLEAARIAKEAGTQVYLNPAPVGEIPEELIALCDYMTPNESELSELSGGADVEAGIADLLHRGVRRVCVTLGEEGAVLNDGETSYNAPAVCGVTAVDTTAAGDAFNAALVVALGRGESIETALRYANAVGALTVSRYGAQPSLPTRQEVEEFLGAGA